MCNSPLTVVVPRDQVNRLHAYLNEVLAPYNEGEWVIGGRWSGYFKVKPNMPYVLGDGPWGEEETPEVGWGDIVRQGDVDWDEPPLSSHPIIDKEGKMREEWREYIDSCHFEDMLVNVDVHV